jgi:branched-chain amino acid transport system substrate-binding protein
VSMLTGEPEYVDPLGAEAPVGWIVTGYPYGDLNTPEHVAFRDAYKAKYGEMPKLGSVVGYETVNSIAAALAKAGSTDNEKLITTLEGLKRTTVFGPIEFRAIDHQSTMGAFVGTIALKDGLGVMSHWSYRDGAKYLPPDSEVKILRPAG